jgi:hypothetical protein
VIDRTYSVRPGARLAHRAVGIPTGGKLVKKRNADGIRAAARRSLAVLALLSTTACYTTRPVGGERPAAGSRVVLTLSPSGTTDMAAQLGPGVARAEGVVREVRGDTLALELTRTVAIGGSDNLWQRQLVTVPSSAVASVAERRLDRKRSWLVAGIGVGLAAIAAAIATGGGATEGSGSVVTPPN